MFDDLLAEAGRVVSRPPNIDLALAALAFVGGIDPTAPLFAIARIAGWAAHLAEELGRAPGPLPRPRPPPGLNEILEPSASDGPWLHLKQTEPKGVGSVAGDAVVVGVERVDVVADDLDRPRHVRRAVDTGRHRHSVPAQSTSFGDRDARP